MISKTQGAILTGLMLYMAATATIVAGAARPAHVLAPSAVGIGCALAILASIITALALTRVHRLESELAELKRQGERTAFGHPRGLNAGGMR